MKTEYEIMAHFFRLNEAGVTPDKGWDELTKAQQDLLSEIMPDITEYFKHHEPEDMAQAEEKLRKTN